MMTTKKHKREDYSHVGDVHLNDEKTGNTFWVEVLAALDDILETQGPLALESRFNKNKQMYGPFLVRVHVERAKTKEHRKKKETERQ